MAELALDAPAKLNLVLAVGPLREDGYHHLASVITPLELCDRVTVRVEEGSGAVQVAVPGLDGGDTLATRAARGYLDATGQADIDVDVAIDKHVPAGGGLGGGSSNAAAVLRALDQLVGSVDADTLRGIAAGIGSDVPCFLHDGPTIVRGRGEVVEPLDGLPQRRFLVAWPRVAQSTGSVYAAYQPRRDALPASMSLAECARNGTFYNDLAGTALALCAPLRDAERVLREQGLAPLVAGSGASIAAPIGGDDDVSGTVAALEAAGCRVWITGTR